MKKRIAIAIVRMEILEIVIMIIMMIVQRLNVVGGVMRAAVRVLEIVIMIITVTVKEIVNAGEETVVHLAVGSGRAITAVINAAGEVTKIGVETVSNVAGSVAGGVTKAIGLDKKKEDEENMEE